MNKDEKIKQFNEYLNEFHQGAKILLQDKKLFIKLIFVHFIGLISSYLIPLTLAYAMGISSYTGIEAIVLSSYVMLIGAFVLFPNASISGVALVNVVTPGITVPPVTDP